MQAALSLCTAAASKNRTSTDKYYRIDIMNESAGTLGYLSFRLLFHFQSASTCCLRVLCVLTLFPNDVHAFSGSAHLNDVDILTYTICIISVVLLLHDRRRRRLTSDMTVIVGDG